jgi:hypothetical protein
MHQTRKGKRWDFGLKAHIGVDSKEGVVHSVCTSAASVADKHMLPDLLHGEERKVWGDGGYQGQTEAIQEAAPHAQDMTCRRTKFKNYVDEEAKRKNTTKSKVRAKVEHVFRILKRVFGFDKVRYRGIAKNHHRLCANSRKTPYSPKAHCGRVVGLLGRRLGVGGRSFVPALPQAIAVAVHLQDMNVVGEPVEQGSSEALGGRGSRSTLEGQVAGDQG